MLTVNKFIMTMLDLLLLMECLSIKPIRVLLLLLHLTHLELYAKSIPVYRILRVLLLQNILVWLSFACCTKWHLCYVVAQSMPR